MKAELEFLPAALEIQETPPLPASRWFLWTIILLFASGIIWACIGRVDIISSAHGKIVPSGRIKIIQPLETAVVKNILVKEGQYVQAGQVLVELDTTEKTADKDRLLKEKQALELDRSRLRALIDAVTSSSFDSRSPIADPRSRVPDPHSQTPDPSLIDPPAEATVAEIELQSHRLRQQYSEYLASLNALHEEQRQKQAERHGIEEQIAKLNATLPLITERAQSLKSLSDKQMGARADWLKLEQEHIEQAKEKDIQLSQLPMLDAEIENLAQRRQALEAETQGKWLTELTDTETKLSSLNQDLIKAQNRYTLQQLTAPVAGTIQQLAVHTIGGVVTPAQELMRIVPEEDSIQIEAWVENKDIGFVYDGLGTEIKIETFPYTKYGTLTGRLTKVSTDAIADEKKGLIYAAEVHLDQTTMNIDGKTINLTPGMAVTVEVNQGKRRLIEYLLSPLLKYKSEAVRER